MKNSIRYIALLSVSIASFIAAWATGFIPVRNFARDTYSGGPQNWAAIQDSTGRVYIGNRDGMISFDGERWNISYLANYTTVRSMMFDKDTERIYAGGSEEFGYFRPDSITGMLRYESLLPLFGDNRPQFTEIWNIFGLDGKIWFQGDYCIFCVDDGKIVSYHSDRRISTSALIGQSLFAAFDGGSLVRLIDGEFLQLPHTDSLHGKKITGILPFGDSTHLLVATSVNGLYVYDGTSARELDCDITGFLKDNQIFCAASSGNDYVFGTVNRGAVVKNFANGSTFYINKESGLQNNTVLNASFDKSGNLWLCLDNGLDYAIYNSPIASLIGSANAVGAGYTSIRAGNRVYFGTNQGLYSAPYPFRASPAPISLSRELQGQIWSLIPDDDDVFVCADAGLFSLSDGIISKISGLPGTYHVQKLRGKPDRVLVSTYHQFHCLVREDGHWRDTGPVKGYDDIGGNFTQDQRGFIWLPHWRKGVYRLHYDPDKNEFDECLLFSENDGLPSNHNTMVTLYKGRIAFATPVGFYTYDYNTSEIVPDKELEGIFGAGKAGAITSLPDGGLLVGENTGFNVARYGSDGKYNVTTTSFSSLSDKIIPGYIHLDYISPKELLISNQDGFWSIDTEYRSRNSWHAQPFVNTVYANRDSLVYRALPSGRQVTALDLPYNLNSLRFDFACPDFRTPNSVEYSSFLENYDNDWTPFAPESTKEYTRLAEGNYTLRLRVRDVQTGEIAETSFDLHISPPWFRTVWAKTAYTLLAALLLLAGGMFARRWLRDARRQLELRQQREMDELRQKAEQEALVKDYEIATLKSEQLEHDIKHKSQELSSTTMNLIRKNEILHDIAAKIAKIQEMPGLDSSPGGIQRQLAKIQSSIEENISHDDDWKTFTQNFDIVYENYTKRLMELHPNLSAADKRLCCYIKMGLSSKEIAPLINISYKSVEMARYRLRKKMDLPAETSLSTYLDNL